jgi:hypothetical protein
MLAEATYGKRHAEIHEAWKQIQKQRCERNNKVAAQRSPKPPVPPYNIEKVNRKRRKIK